MSTTTTSAIDRLISQLEQGGYDPRSTGPDGWESRCPAHNGDRWNLSITRKSDGTILVHCHRGCSSTEVLDAIGMTLRDLFPQSDHFSGNGHPKRPTGKGKPKTVHKARQDAIKAALWSVQQKAKDESWRLTKSWDYPDGLVMARFENASGEKTYRPVYKTADGWMCGDPPGKLPLYHRDELADAETVWHFKGGSADLARSLGLAATTTAHEPRAPEKRPVPSRGKDRPPGPRS